MWAGLTGWLRHDGVYKKKGFKSRDKTNNLMYSGIVKQVLCNQGLILKNTIFSTSPSSSAPIPLHYGDFWLAWCASVTRCKISPGAVHCPGIRIYYSSGVLRFTYCVVHDFRRSPRLRQRGGGAYTIQGAFHWLNTRLVQDESSKKKKDFHKRDYKIKLSKIYTSYIPPPDILSYWCI